jgi:hypothetical protein
MPPGRAGALIYINGPRRKLANPQDFSGFLSPSVQNCHISV